MTDAGEGLPATVNTPWSPEQVEALNFYQKAGIMHPYTCGNDSDHEVLLATPKGWICRNCDYHQTWAHAFTTNMTALRSLSGEA